MAADSTLQAVLFFCLLLAASVWDLRKRIIPDSICLFIALTGLINFSPVRLWGVLAALPLLIAALCKPEGIGGGTSSSPPPQGSFWDFGDARPGCCSV